jgi:hypothetical protein
MAERRWFRELLHNRIERALALGHKGYQYDHVG